MRTVTIVIDKNGVAIVELEEFQGKGIRSRTAWTLEYVERAIMHSNSQQLTVDRLFREPSIETCGT